MTVWNGRPTFSAACHEVLPCAWIYIRLFADIKGRNLRVIHRITRNDHGSCTQVDSMPWSDHTYTLKVTQLRYVQRSKLAGGSISRIWCYLSTMACYKGHACSEVLLRFGCISPRPCHLFQLRHTSSTYQRCLVQWLIVWEIIYLKVGLLHWLLVQGCQHEACMDIKIVFMLLKFSLLHPRWYIRTCSLIFRICMGFFRTDTPVEVRKVKVDHPFLTTLVRVNHFQLGALLHVPFGYPLVHPPCDTTVATYSLSVGTLS